MDNRWRFLYCCMTELWGRMGGARAGGGKPGASGEGEGRGKTALQSGDVKRSEKE